MFQRPEGQEEVGTAMSSLLSGMSDFYHAVRLDLNQPAKHLADSLGRHDPFRILVVWRTAFASASNFSSWRINIRSGSRISG
ncbi:hypothetical protein [Ensifer adhaerens]